MSVQLIVYPQNYDGYSNAMSASSTEFLSNGITFTNLNNTGTYTSSASPPFADIIANAPPSIPNTWYRFRNSTGGVPDFPVESSNNLILKSVSGSGSISGVYQKLTNLTVGIQYTITVNTSAATTGVFITQIYDGNVQGQFGGGVASSTVITSNFTATSANPTLFIAFADNSVTTSTITSVSVQPVIGAINSGAIQVLGNGQVICDLYEDEDLPLSLSVDDFKNVAEKVQSYSKAFNLPGTKRNNRIFDHIFEITREVASAGALLFNPYTRTQCVLKQDGFILFEGYLRLIDVTDKEGEISYNVNLYSEVIALADFLGDKVFSDLDFKELEHDYNRTEILNSWNDGTAGQTTPITWINPNTSGYRTDFNTLKYPFVDWNHQILIGGSSGSGNSAASGFPELPNLETAFRPFINIKYLIDRIFEATNFTYESVFFSTSDFGNLYMDFNWGSGNAPIVFNTNRVLRRNLKQDLTTSYATLDFNSVTPPSEFGYSAGVFTAVTDSQTYNISFNMIFKNAAGENLDIEWVINGLPSFVVNVGINPTPSSFNYTGSFTVILNTGDTIFCRAKSTGSTMYLEGGSNSIITNTSSNQTTNDTLLGTLRGELGQWDFLKGLITMFNLVTLPDGDNPNNIKIEPYADVFINSSNSVQLDWTEKIDISEMKLTPLTNLNLSTLFKFVEDDDDYSFNKYKFDVGGHLYGSKKFNAGNAFNILKGKDVIIAEPFAATVVKPLMSQFPQFITPSIYAMNDDGNSEGFDNSPRIMFNNGVKSTGASYYIPTQNGGLSSNALTFLQFSHLSDIPTVTSIPPLPSDTRDFHFGECQLMQGVGVATVNNLFNLYWLPYYNELYNPNTRIMTIKVNLSPADINTFKFNDTVYLKNRLFRVNKIDYKPNDLATVEFILIP